MKCLLKFFDKCAAKQVGSLVPQHLLLIKYVEEIATKANNDQTESWIYLWSLMSYVLATRMDWASLT